MPDPGPVPWDAQGMLSAYIPQSRYFSVYFPLTPSFIHFSPHGIQVYIQVHIPLHKL